MKFWTGFMMAGIGFTIGLLCGLLAHLPAETLPAATFDSHHLNRVRRVAQVENGADYVVSDNLFSDIQGSVGKQIGAADSMNGDYETLPVENLDNRRFKGIEFEKKQQLNVLNKYPNSNPESVVYVSSDKQKLVLDNNVNTTNDSNQIRKSHNSDTSIDNTVIPNYNNVNTHENAGERSASGQGDHSADKIEIDNYRLESLSSGSDVISGVFWTESVEQSCPKGFSNEEIQEWRRKASNEKFLSMNEGCGRMQNRLLTFENLDKACARYRLNVDQMQGEVYSYYLGKLLGINNVPPSVLHVADSNKDQWRMIGQEVANAKWSEEKPVILSKWINGLTPSYIPQEFRNLSKVLLPKDLKGNTKKLDNKLVKGDTGSSLCELLQWSDLIIFDYLTANLDRVVNNLFNLQWNDRMMSKPAHNLEHDSDGRLVFLDNESGLFHGYRLLEKYATYHDSLLNSLCVFRKKTIGSIQKLVESDSISDSLHSLVEKSESLHRTIPRIPVKNIKILKSRMESILRQVHRCESQS